MSLINRYLPAILLMMLTPIAAHSQTPRIDFIPEEVFAGHSKGEGELTLLLGKARPFTVQSVGAIQNDGSFRLDQEVHFEGKPIESRSWVIRQSESGTYTGTLTGASGPITGYTEGNRMTLYYSLNNWGLRMEQTMDLAQDRRTIMNYGSIRFFCIPIGELRETIWLAR